MPAKIVARRTETKVKKAEKVASRARALNVRGNEQIQEIMAAMAENPMVQIP